MVNNIAGANQSDDELTHTPFFLFRSLFLFSKQTYLTFLGSTAGTFQALLVSLLARFHTATTTTITPLDLLFFVVQLLHLAPSCLVARYRASDIKSTL
jgi:hypothetical protein